MPLCELIGKCLAGPSLSVSSVQAPANCCGRLIHNLEMHRLNQETKDKTGQIVHLYLLF